MNRIQSRDMTQGNIVSHMIQYTLPLMIGNVFHLLYNTIDSVIVGNVNGKEALAAIGAAGPVMNILLFLIVGISMGSSILMANYFGAGDYSTLKRQVVTATLGTLLFTFLLSIVSLLSCRTVLVLTRTPASVLSDARAYLNIIIMGLVFSALYNVLAAALRAIGNAAAPLWILILSSVLNIVLDVVLVGACGMGVRGAACATVIAQIVSALACVIYIYRKVPCFRITWKECRWDLYLLQKTVRYSSVSAFQQTILYAGRILVQAAVNTLGVDAVAAFNITTIIDNFALEPNNSLANALMTFTAQNAGAGKKERIASGYRAATVLGVILNVGIALLVYVNTDSLISLFIGQRDAAVVVEGMKYLHIMCFGYILTVFCNTFQGLFRGVGKLKVTLTATLIQIPIRIAVSYLFVNSLGIRAIPVGTILGWVCMIAYEYHAYREDKGSWTETGR